MAKYFDYFIYMSHALHRQWHYGNRYTSPGCDGNCLRPHVNKTETHNALALITKADVPVDKIVVGASSYGCSFEMAESGCTGPTYKSTGSSTDSTGDSTNTGGYISNAELQLISDNALLGHRV